MLSLRRHQPVSFSFQLHRCSKAGCSLRSARTFQGPAKILDDRLLVAATNARGRIAPRWRTASKPREQVTRSGLPEFSRRTGEPDRNRTPLIQGPQPIAASIHSRSGGQSCQARVGGHLRAGNCRFWFCFARPAASSHRDARGFQVEPDRLRRTPVVCWMRDSVQPRRPSARICRCVVSSRRCSCA